MHASGLETRMDWREAIQNEEGPHMAGLLRVFFENLLLREGPPEIGVIVRAIIVASHTRIAHQRCDEFVADEGNGIHGPT